VIDEIQKLYRGFYLTQAVGNNSFSFNQRRHQQVYVAAFENGTSQDLALGQEIVFSEVEGGVEHNKTGLKNFLRIDYQGKDVFIFDNHNHAFFFWAWGKLFNKFSPHAALIHVDQHKDTREASSRPDIFTNHRIDLSKTFRYTNEVLNVGNFIKPAFTAHFFKSLIMVDHEAAFNSSWPEGYVLDLDMDIFSPEMNYIDEKFKIQKIRALIDGARLITVATSPYFVDQDKAVELIRNKLFIE
jgi:hypothetical protein